MGFRTAKATKEHRRMAWEGQPERVKVPYLKCELAWQDPEYRRTRGIRWEDGGTTLQA